MPRYFEIAPEIAQAALDRRQPAQEHRLALQLPLPDFYRDPPAPHADMEDDGAALVMDRDGSFSRTRY